MLNIKHNNWLTDITYLTAIFGCLFFTFLGCYALFAPDGARYAEIPREMLIRGNYLTPYLNGIKYFEKPILFYWLQCGTFKLFGINEWAARIPTATIALFGCLITYSVSRKLYDRLTGWIASLILATSILYFILTRIITIDMTLTVLLSSSLLCFILANQKQNYSYLWPMYIFAALAFLTKGLIAIVLPGLIIFTWILLTNNWRKLKNYHLILGTILFLLITIPWHALVQIKSPEFFKIYFIQQHLQRYITPMAGRSQPSWYLPLLLFLGLFPWSYFAIPALKKTSRTELFFVLWAAIIFIFFWLSKSQLPPYLLPILPPLAIIFGRYLAINWRQTPPGINISFNLTSSTLIIIAIGAFYLLYFNLLPYNINPDYKIYLAISLLGLTGIITAIAKHRHQTRGGFIALTSGILLTWIALTPNMAVFNQKSTKPLTDIINQDQQSKTVVSYKDYYQDLPFYTRQLAVVVNFLGELEPGSYHQDTDNLLWSEKTLWQHWRNSAKIYMLSDQEHYAAICRRAPSKPQLVAKYRDTILLTNHKD